MQELGWKQTHPSVVNDVSHPLDFAELYGLRGCAALACMSDSVSQLLIVLRVAHAAGICHFLFRMPLADWASRSLLHSSLPLQPNDCQGNNNNTLLYCSNTGIALATLIP